MPYFIPFDSAVFFFNTIDRDRIKGLTPRAFLLKAKIWGYEPPFLENFRAEYWWIPSGIILFPHELIYKDTRGIEIVKFLWWKPVQNFKN